MHLGPVWYLERRGFELFPGDVTEVKGIRKTEKNGRLSVVAYELIKGDEVLVLRDSEGWPIWPGAGTPLARLRILRSSTGEDLRPVGCRRRP